MNLGDHKAALATFVRVVQMGETPSGGVRGPARRDLEPLIKEARKDIVVAYARVGGPDRAWDFFRRTGGESATRMMEALAERYWEQGQGADSTRVYRKLMAEAPASPAVCAWQTKVLRNALSLNDKRDQAVELERLGAVVDRAAPPARERTDECRARLSRCRARAGAGVAPRGAEDPRRRHLSPRGARVPAVSRALPRRTATPTR